MPIYEINPQTDPRWAELVESHSRSSVFHTVEWLQALERTYGYTSTVFTSSPPNVELGNGIPFCRVNSWLTGSRLVSLPFSDHCEPLIRDDVEFQGLLSDLLHQFEGTLKYVELRPRCIGARSQPGIWPSAHYCLSVIDLRPDLDTLYSRLHKDSVQRKLRRAEREHLVLETGQSDDLLNEFYKLLVMTRRRHQLPPQPLSWFRNLLDRFGPRLTIHVARMDQNPIASILTIRHKKTLVYKYGCSDAQFHNAGGMPFLFWHAILSAKAEDIEEFDLGRSDLENEGLIRFKDHLGADRTSINYWRTTPGTGRVVGQDRKWNLAKKVFFHLPDGLFRLAGEVLYRHIG